MKDIAAFIVILTAVLVVALCTTWVVGDKPAVKVTVTNKRMNRTTSIYWQEIQRNNHDYLLAKLRGNVGVTVLHNPDCRCRK